MLTWCLFSISTRASREGSDVTLKKTLRGILRDDGVVCHIIHSVENMVLENQKVVSPCSVKKGAPDTSQISRNAVHELGMDSGCLRLPIHLACFGTAKKEPENHGAVTSHIGS